MDSRSAMYMKPSVAPIARVQAFADAGPGAICGQGAMGGIAPFPGLRIGVRDLGGDDSVASG
jgi:hypothetical protein